MNPDASTMAYGALALAIGTIAMIVSVRIRLQAIPGETERTWFLRMSIFVWSLVAFAVLWIWLMPRNLSTYGRYLLLPAVLVIPWFSSRMRRAREEDLQADSPRSP